MEFVSKKAVRLRFCKSKGTCHLHPIHGKEVSAMSTWVPSTSVFVPTFELGRPLRVVEVQEAHHQVKMIKQIGKEFEDGNLLVL